MEYLDGIPMEFEAPIMCSPSKRAWINKRLRKWRLIKAREKGTHTNLEWELLKVEFKDTCVQCFGESGLIGVVKDHIVPIYQGGSDSIENIQPLCVLCNCRKGPDSFNWKEYRRKEREESLVGLA